MKDKALRVLMIEDSEDDTLFIIRELKKSGYNPVYERVETAAAMKKALKKKPWDIILCEYSLTKFNAPSAIALLREENIDIPVIIVSGTIGEEAGIDCMYSGAKDYIMKGNMSRLCPAIARELKYAEIRNRGKRTEVKLQQTLESLKKEVGVTIQVLVSALEAREPYAAGHQSRVADLACAIASEMGLTQDKIDGIHMAGFFHDIGVLSISAEILSKTAKLTGSEFSLIKEHSQSGYEILKNVEAPWPLAEIVYQHHERMDGSGYPRNLKGDEILLEARILAVADVVEAMASPRPYRVALSMDVVLDEIEKNRRILYDDAVVDACLKLFWGKDYQLK
jgi:HD-GYP domain-containing protein (c-di-GMP phosphodiesterase class II)